MLNITARQDCEVRASTPIDDALTLSDSIDLGALDVYRRA